MSVAVYVRWEAQFWVRFIFMENVITIMSSRISELIRTVYQRSEEIIRMPQFVQFTIAIVMRVKMARRKPDDKDSTGDASKEKKSKEKVKEVKKRPARKKYDCKMIQQAVEEYWKGQQLVTKVTYVELAEKYLIPASTIKGYHRKDLSGTMPVTPAHMGRKCVLELADEEKSITCCSAVIGVVGRTEHNEASLFLYFVIMNVNLVIMK